MSESRRAPAIPVHADDSLVVGYLNPRPIHAWILVGFGQISFRLAVKGFQARRFGIHPDPVKA